MIDLNAFCNDGFALIPGVIGHEVVELLIGEIESLRAANADHSYAGMRNLLTQSPAVRQLASCPELRNLVESILGVQAFATRALLFDKSETANWWVGWHQDRFITVREKLDVPGFHGFWRKAGVLHVIPPVDVLAGMLTMRVHLDDSPADNGPLQVMSGSHRWGLLSPEGLAGREQWGLLSDESETLREPNAPVVTCSMDRGGVLLMRPLLLHASQKATRPVHRRVIHLEYAACDLPGGLEWNDRCY